MKVLVLTGEGKMEQAKEYIVRQRSSGSYEITGGDLRDKGVHVPSDAVLKVRYERELAKDRMSSSLKTHLAWRGYIAVGKRSAGEGRKAIGVKLRKIKTKNGEVDRKTTWEDVVRVVDAEYPINRVALYLAGEEVKLRSIKEFGKRHNREYHAAHSTYGPQLGKGNGFKIILEKLRP